MISVMKNTYTLFRKNKELIYLITIQPVMIFLLMSFLLPYKSTHDIVVSKESNSEAAVFVLKNLQALEGISVREIDAEKITEKLIGGNAELAILITDSTESDLPQVNLISIEGSEVEDAVELCVNESLRAYRSGDTGAGAEVSVNAAPKKWISISNSLAFMIFKTLTAGNLLGALIIEERRNRMKDRIMLSGVKKSSYLLGMALVYLAFMMIGSVSYYLVGLVLNFDFGMRNSLGFLLMLFISNMLSVSIYVFFAAFLKKEDALGFVGTFILMPMSLFSGVLFPFRYMPQAMQRIGSCFPQRWIAYGIEKMQQSGAISSGLKEALMVLVVSVVLFVIGMCYEGKTNKSKRRASVGLS
ncbi:MAG: ABC transporter permease [Lachnospiraceae bacterium]|nr:ABC transporter permease [Lachnospiraceae bacterium]